MALLDYVAVYYSLDEASGDAIDAFGAEDLTDNSAVGATTGKVSGARSFDDTSWFQDADNASTSVSSDFALVFWFKTSDAGIGGLVTKDDLGSNREYAVIINGGIVTFQVFDSSSGDASTSSASGFDNGAWHLCIAQYKASDKKVRVYLDNGSEVLGSTPLTNGPMNAAAPFSLGALGAGNFTYVGDLDEVALLKGYVLDGTDRSWIWNSGSGRSYAEWVSAAGGAGVARQRLVNGGLVRGRLVG